MQAIRNLVGLSARDFTLVLCGAFLLSLASPLAIRLPFSPIPIVIQNIIALYLGVLLGSKRGMLAVLLYLFQGSVGLPVFAFGKGSILSLVGTNGGYLIGYALGAYVTGFFYERSNRGFASFSAAMLLGVMTMYITGSLWLSTFIGFKSAFFMGVAPFVVLDVMKILFLAGAKRTIERFFPAQ